VDGWVSLEVSPLLAQVALDWTLDLCFAEDFACVNPPPLRNLRAVMPGSIVEDLDPIESNLLEKRSSVREDRN
jgi:hypothetical protein